MSGWRTVYLDTGTEAAARSLAMALGSDLEPGQYSTGDENYVFLGGPAYGPLLADHDDAAWAYPVLSRFNTDRPEGLAAYNAMLATAYVKTPSNPSNVWAGDAP
jgi:hypothetical protein